MSRTFAIAAFAVVSLFIGASDASAACLELCSGHGLCIEDTCLCDPGFEGQACEKTSAACPNDCGGRGVCQFGKCFCQEGFAGPDCSENVGTCPGGCGAFGTCIFDQCQCKLGWTGPQCATPVLSCPSDCSGHGICNDDAVCVCDPGYSGEACAAEATCPKDCSGRGICKLGQCYCEAGFSGPACDVDAKTCPNGCSGTGVCLDGTCACVAGFEGPDCSTPKACPKDCNGRGVCQYGQCYCAPGFDGDACQTEQVCPDNCSNNGRCLYGKCFCDAGFEGGSCSKVSPPCDLCSDRGICLFGGKCLCPPGFQGDKCEKAVTCDKGCGERGVCQYGKCFCEPGFTGDSCEKAQPCENDCRGRGVCSLGQCFCQPGFAGKDCGEQDGDVLDTATFDNPIFSAPVGAQVNILAKGASPSITITLTRAETGEELQVTQHLLPPNLVNNSVIRSAGFSGAISADRRDASPFEVTYSLSFESLDPNEPGVVLVDFPVRMLTSFVSESVGDAVAGALKDTKKANKSAFKAGDELTDRLQKLVRLAGLDAMDADFFPEGSWVAAAEQTLAASGFADQGGTATVISLGVPVSQEECWDVFTKSPDGPCASSTEIPFGDFKSLPKHCRPPGRLQFDYKLSKDGPPEPVLLVALVHHTRGLTQFQQFGFLTAAAATDGGDNFVFGTSVYFRLAAGSAETAQWPAVGSVSATIGEVLEGETSYRQVATYDDADLPAGTDELGLPSATPAFAGVTIGGIDARPIFGDEGTRVQSHRRRTKGGFVVDIDGIDAFLPGRQGGGGASGSWRPPHVQAGAWAAESCLKGKDGVLCGSTDHF
ncbi:MAG: hypothetical protein R3F39_19525 [Myxococcota bacterium]